MSIMVKFELNAQKDKEVEIHNFFERILKGTRDFSGNEGVKISHSFEDKAKLVLIEYWQTQEDFDKYLNWRKDIGDFETLGTMLSVDPDMQIFQVIDNA